MKKQCENPKIKHAAQKLASNDSTPKEKTKAAQILAKHKNSAHKGNKK